MSNMSKDNQSKSEEKPSFSVDINDLDMSPNYGPMPRKPEAETNKPVKRSWWQRLLGKRC